MKLKEIICLTLSSAAILIYARTALAEGGSLQIFYNNNQSIQLQSSNCKDRVAYCVNEMLQSASRQLPLQYNITRISYVGPPPASQQVAIYTNQQLTEGSCDENQVFAEALSKQPITNITAFHLNYIKMSCNNHQPQTIQPSLPQGKPLSSTPQEGTPAAISEYAKMLK